MPQFFIGNVTLLVAAIAWLSTATPASAAAIFTDRSLWEAAVAGFTTDTFDNVIANAESIDLDDGTISTAMPGLGSSGLNNVGVTGSYVGLVGMPFNQPQSIQWTRLHPIIGFFGDFSDINEPDGLTVMGDFDGTGDQTISIAATIGTAGGFGIIGTSSFTSFSWGTNDQSEQFAIDNFSRATNVTPEPATFAVWSILALCAVAAGCWRRRKTTAA